MESSAAPRNLVLSLVIRDRQSSKTLLLFGILVLASRSMAPRILNKWFLNTTNLPAGELMTSKSHIMRCLPAIMGSRDSVAIISSGGLPHQKTTKSGLELLVRIIDDDGIEWAREVMRSGLIFITRNGLTRPILSTAKRYLPSTDANDWRDRLLVTIPDEVPLDSEENVGQPVLSSPVIIGGAIGAIAGSMIYGGTNHWIRPIGLILAGLFLGVAETTSYPIVSTSSSLILNMTSEFVEIATESRNNFWITLKSWIMDLLFFLTTSAFAMAGVRYAYLEIAECLVAMTRQIIFGTASIAPTPTIVTHSPAFSPRPVIRCPPPFAPIFPNDHRNVRTVDDVVDSSATSGQSEDDQDLKDSGVDPSERCKADRLFVGVEGIIPLSTKKCMGKYRHLTPATLGDQLRTSNGIRLHDEEKVQLCDSRFTHYRTYNEENQCREIGRRERAPGAPFGDIIIRDCQKHMHSHVLRRSPGNPVFQQQDVFPLIRTAISFVWVPTITQLGKPTLVTVSDYRDERSSGVIGEWVIIRSRVLLNDDRRMYPM